MIDDLGEGSKEKSLKNPDISAYEEFMKDKYDNQLEIADII